uniref:Aminopeptidase n=1 Tax=Stomoxys calcitrans TaxID=35570 RepID=A0A1I8NMG2_STOCA
MKWFFAKCVVLLIWIIQFVASSIVTDYRLPTSLQPDSYTLKIVTHLEKEYEENSTFNGEVAVNIQVLEDTKSITLHARNLNVSESSIELKSHKDDDFKQCIEEIETVKELDFFVIHLCHPLFRGLSFELKMSYIGTFTQDMRGYYISKYNDEATNKTKWLSVTSFEPDYARVAFPCFDEPHLKAKFTIWLGHHRCLTALSNMPLEKQIPMDASSEFVWSIFEESVPMSSYLVAFTIHDLTFTESKAEGSDVVFRTWSQKSMVNSCSYAAEMGPKILKYYEELLGIDFPMRKIDAVAIPDLYGAGMENWGLITYRQNSLTLNISAESKIKQSMLTTIIAHELAHQWFGNLVTMKWWTDLWLNEGFATYISSLGAKFVMPDHDKYISETVVHIRLIFDTDSVLNTHPISDPNIDKNELKNRFDDISYLKGSSVVRMMHLFLGQEAFFEGIRNYLSHNKYQSVTQDDLWAFLTESAVRFNRLEGHCNMKTIMDTWTLQAGYPLVNVNRDLEKGTVTISQERFLKNTTTLSADEANKCWWIPLSYTSASEGDFGHTIPKLWLKCNATTGGKMTLNLNNVEWSKNDWVIFNLQLSGIYRVNYDAENWKLLGEALKSPNFGNIPLIHRVQLLIDVAALAKSGHIGYSIVFDIMEYLVQERELLPWRVASESFTGIFKAMSQIPEYRSQIYAYFRHITEPILKSNFSDTNNTIENMDLARIMKTIIAGWACRVEVEDCIRTANANFEQWKAAASRDEVTEIPREWRDITLCAVIRQGKNDNWKIL